MNETTTRVLLIEDNPGDADLIRALVSSKFEIEHADRLVTGLRRLALGGVDVVLLDLSLPDSHGLATLHAAHNQASEVPIVVLTGLDDETLALEALQQGAEDYVVKAQLDENLLARAVRYAIERSRSQRRLRESNRLIQQIVDILYFYDARQQTIVYGSWHFAEMLGLKPEQIQKERPSLPQDLLHPDDLGVFKEHIEKLLAAKDDEIVEGGYRIKVASGKWKWISVRETVFTRNVSGSPALILGSAHDITEQMRLADEVKGLQEKLDRAAEERSIRDSSGPLSYRVLYDSAPDMMAVLDMAEGRILQCNEALAQATGREKESLVGRSFWELYDPEHKQVVQDRFAEFQQNGSVLHSDGVFRRADGSPLHVRLQCVPIRDEGGKIVAGCSVWKDMTDRRRADEAVAKLVQDLAQSNAELEQFAYVASHDLKEPVRKIQAFVNRLQMNCGETLSGQGRDFLDRIQNAARRMQTLINDLLQFSCATGRSQLAFRNVDLTLVVKEILTDLEVAVEECGAQVEVGELPTICADPIQMRLLAQNLIGNALKFRRPGVTPIVKVYARFRSQDGARNSASNNEGCELVVEDNGIGIDEKYSDRIFGIFQRLHNHLEYEGTGLGLALCRKIAERHGGTISFRSEVGKGAIFAVKLPLNPERKGQTS